MKKINYEESKEELISEKEISVVCFGGEWCPYCREFFPEFKKWKAPTGIKKIIAELDKEESPWWDLYNIEVVPTLMVIECGEKTYQRDGERSVGLNKKDLEKIEEFLEKRVNNDEDLYRKSRSGKGSKKAKKGYNRYRKGGPRGIRVKKIN